METFSDSRTPTTFRRLYRLDFVRWLLSRFDRRPEDAELDRWNAGRKRSARGQEQGREEEVGESSAHVSDGKEQCEGRGWTDLKERTPPPLF